MGGIEHVGLAQGVGPLPAGDLLALGVAIGPVVAVTRHAGVRGQPVAEVQQTRKPEVPGQRGAAASSRPG